MSPATLAACAVDAIADALAALEDADLRATWHDTDALWTTDDPAGHLLRQLVGAEILYRREAARTRLAFRTAA